MPDPDAAASTPMRPSVFLSYASGDRAAARLLRDALPDLGLEVWYDESDLGGGEAWDQKIRRQIRECDYFMPLISAQTEARNEGYFRREWRLAVERTLDMADGHLFLLPIVIDDTDQATAKVPEKFLAVQWLKVPGGEPTPAFESLCRRVASGNVGESQSVRSPAGRSGTTRSTPLPPSLEFPREEPGQRIRFWVAVVGWAIRSAWALFKRWPRWLRILIYLWIGVVAISRCESTTPKHRHEADVSPAAVEKLKAISKNYEAGANKGDVSKLGTEIAKQFADESDDDSEEGSPLLAIPFTAPAGDATGSKLAESAFAMTYGMASISHQGQVGLNRTPMSTQDLSGALERGKASHATYVLYGAIDTVGGAQVLSVKIAAVADGSVRWSKSYPAEGADASKIAAEVDSKIPTLTPR